VVVWALTAVFTASASACNDPILQAIEPSSGGPGDVVSFTIINTSPGATYAVSIEGGMRASGRADGSHVTGTFTMPDLGRSATTVSIEAVVTHEDIAEGSIPTSRAFNYRPPAASSAPAPAADLGQSAPTPSAQSDPVAQSSPPAAGHAGPDQPAPPGVRHSGKHARSKQRLTPARSPVRRPSVARDPVSQPAATRATLQRPIARPEVATAPLVRARPARHQVERRRTVRASAIKLRPAGVPSAVGVAAAKRSGPIDRGVAEDTTAVAAMAILVALLGGIGRSAVRVWRSVPLPTAPGWPRSLDLDAIHDPVEAELQEIVAHERARNRTGSGVP
jgi:hypothetical protein